MKFTPRSLEALKPCAARYEVWEDNGKGFGLRVAPSGRKSFVFLYRFDGRPRRMTLGSFPRTSLAVAHKSHASAMEELDRGIDPGLTKQAEKRSQRLAPTVADLAAEYLEKWAKPRKRSWREDERILGKDVLPVLGKRKARDIARRDVILLLDGIVDRGAPITANRTLAVMRRMFNFGVSRDIVPATPCSAIPAPAKEKQRDRVLTESELKDLLEGLPDADIPENVQLALRLQLITAQRKGEIVNARWQQFDLETAWWTIPAERSKNGLPHRVPLTDIALEVLAKARALAADSDWVFPSSNGLKPIREDAVNRAVYKNAYLKLERWTPHDLRRTAASMMTSLGVSRLVAAKVLNHVEHGITAVYDRHSYDNEKRQALELWSKRLTEVYFGRRASNVVQMHSTRGNK